MEEPTNGCPDATVLEFEGANIAKRQIISNFKKMLLEFESLP